MFLNASLWAVMMGCTYLLIAFTITRSEYAALFFILERGDDDDQLGTHILSQANMLFLRGFSLDAFSPSAVMIEALSCGFLFFILVNVIFASNANTVYEEHYAILNNRMNNVQRHRSRILVEHNVDEESRHSKLVELSNINKAIEVAYNYITDQDKIVFSKFFGLKADSAVLIFIITFAGSAFSVFFAIGSLARQAQVELIAESEIFCQQNTTQT